ncbi:MULTISPECIES: HetP family heterocyst commitment protein [Leptolyngbya]|jgi:hypothetical protein|uniref:Heterocyst differentiation protein n=1 Tax=Leptolyngbya boryana NIES-2135 TaxID=1973484 RepID=A0A1Z4JHN1_LEPBY|nr:MULTISPECIES: HetP family heterocyst commitment protein [Leptolyngbya]BAY56037.1 heterocyst differentiation protein [Leptolyngbya boryana NIES-2135]MBD1857603.1 HetP family heterocyst commitment protein [Leptolyngbya sp. FACHB-1624]MBD2366150.1 HetP family heterocyst commitment protein [Leptolyngbya sp. FACHB-161]MBD2372330.1 HetP family heterocyst commitment protein [Leptolyngbya sp. FACHB-238]MBD2396753.1 HetP family heterocyst commitment protein [Leptolyngbya sp. FACHB-239]
MTQQGFRNSSASLDRVMETEQFNQVIEAILAGKYSWACVLILQFGGYNPLHYIPYRTYNRIMKDHYQAGQKQAQTPDSNPQQPNPIKDLNYLEVVSEPRTRIKGGTFATLEQWLGQCNDLPVNKVPKWQASLLTTD